MKTITKNELNIYLKSLSTKDCKVTKRETLTIFLQNSQLSPEQVTTVFKSESVQYSIDLQYILIQYIKDQDYKEKSSATCKSGDWLHLLAMFAGVGGGC